MASPKVGTLVRLWFFQDLRRSLSQLRTLGSFEPRFFEQGYLSHYVFLIPFVQVLDMDNQKVWKTVVSTFQRSKEGGDNEKKKRMREGVSGQNLRPA